MCEYVTAGANTSSVVLFSEHEIYVLIIAWFISPSAAYMRQWIGSALVQIIACHLFGAKPLFEPMLGYCQLDTLEQTSVKF